MTRCRRDGCSLSWHPQPTDNMAGKNIGVIAGTTNAQAVRDQLARRNLSATLVELRDRGEGIAALARGDLDGFASDKFVLLALARAESLRDFTLLPDDLSFEPFAIMLPRGDWAFRLAVNTALAPHPLRLLRARRERPRCCRPAQ